MFKVGLYKAKPLTVEAIFYDGTEKMAEELCKEYPASFCIGRNKQDDFEGLYILVPLVGGKCDMVPVEPEDVVYREPDGKVFCSVDATTFAKYFTRSRKSKIIVAEEMPEDI